MNNPLLGGTQNQLSQNLQQIKQAWATIKNLGNPQAMMEHVLKNNPKGAEINRLLQEANGNPEKAFRDKAKEMGVNPDEILDLLK